MNKSFSALLMLLCAISVHAAAGMVEKYLFDDNLRISVPKDWKQESFNAMDIKTEQFTHGDRSIILSLCLEEHENRSFTQYCAYRYDAAKSDVWKEIEAKYTIALSFEYDYKVYDHNREDGNKGKFRKLVVCVNGLQKYLTITVIAKRDSLNERMDLLNAIFNSLWIKVATYD